jgi:hypothetical protein
MFFFRKKEQQKSLFNLDKKRNRKKVYLIWIKKEIAKKFI